MIRARLVCPVVFIIDGCGQPRGPFCRIAVSVAREQFLSDVDLPMIREIRKPFDSATLADLESDRSNARWKASLNLGSSDHVEQGADRDQRHLFMAERQKRQSPGGKL